MTVKEIIEEKIRDSGAAGLCHRDSVCGCGDHIGGICLRGDCLSTGCELADRYACAGCGNQCYIPQGADVSEYFCEHCGCNIMTRESDEAASS